jgi:hypothetical protein
VLTKRRAARIESQSALGRSKTPHRLKDWGGTPSELITIRRGRPQLSSQQAGLRSKNTMLIRRLLLGSFHLLPACPFPSRARYSTFPSSEFPKFFSLFNDFTHFPPAPTPKMTGISLGSSKIQHAITSLNLAIDSTGRRDAHQLFVTIPPPGSKLLFATVSFHVSPH